jgi:hypothetical protein
MRSGRRYQVDIQKCKNDISSVNGSVITLSNSLQNNVSTQTLSVSGSATISNAMTVGNDNTTSNIKGKVITDVLSPKVVTYDNILYGAIPHVLSSQGYQSYNSISSAFSLTTTRSALAYVDIGYTGWYFISANIYCTCSATMQVYLELGTGTINTTTAPASLTTIYKESKSGVVTVQHSYAIGQLMYLSNIRLYLVGSTSTGTVTKTTLSGEAYNFLSVMRVC